MNFKSGCGVQAFALSPALHGVLTVIKPTQIELRSALKRAVRR